MYTGQTMPGGGVPLAEQFMVFADTQFITKDWPAPTTAGVKLTCAVGAGGGSTVTVMGAEVIAGSTLTAAVHVTESS